MSDRAMERIRDANPFPNELPAPPIDKVWRRLEAGQEPQSRRGSRSGGPFPARLPGIGGLMTAISAITAVGIAVLAIVLLGHNRSTTAPHPTSPAAASTAAADCIAHGELTRNYSVAELRNALATMPAHVKEYTNCYPVIQQALRAEIGGRRLATSPVAPVHSVSSQLVKHFSVLRRRESRAAHAPAAADLPASAHGQINGMINSPRRSPLGLDLSQIREVSFAKSAPVWVIPGASGVCVVTESAPEASNDNVRTTGTHCERTAAALSSGVISVRQQHSGSPYQVAGIVPNGNSNLVATFASGGTATIPVTDNAVNAYLPAQPKLITFNDAGGRPVSIP